MNRPLLFVIALLIVIPTLYLDTMLSKVTSSLPIPRNKRIGLLIAHPDDEAMFFAPTVMALARPETGNHVRILCLSSGNAEGLGETRKKELVKSGLVLGLRSEDDVSIVDDPASFPDSMNITWSAEKIAAVLHETFTSNSDSHEPTIDTLITFDSQGISSHPNHISLYHGAKAYVSSLTPNDPNPDDPKERIIPVDLYTLNTVSFLRKYFGPFDVLAKLAVNRLAVLGGESSLETRNEKGTQGDHPATLTFVHGLGTGGWATAKEAMTAAHVSQMRWFRYGWIILSRYMYVNDLELDGL